MTPSGRIYVKQEPFQRNRHVVPDPNVYNAIKPNGEDPEHFGDDVLVTPVEPINTDEHARDDVTTPAQVVTLRPQLRKP